MEKNTIQTLVNQISDAIRAKAAEIPDFNNGAFRLLFVPKCEDANSFLGGFGIGCEIDFGFAIKDGGKRTRPAIDGHKECACYGYAAEKIEGCAYALRNNLGRYSDDMPESAETWGRASDKGCVVYEIFANEVGIMDDSLSKLYLRVYVAVSGATGKEDQQCALVAGDILQQWCDIKTDCGFSLTKPE